MFVQFAPSEQSSDPFDLAATASEQAATVPGYTPEQLEDHFGNPDNFIQYIIRVPPVHA